MNTCDPSALPPSFGRALRAQRERRNLGLRHLARMSGLSASYLSRIEHDHLPPPSAKIMNRLARALNTDVETLHLAAGRIPEWVVAVIRERPQTMYTLLTLIAPMTDAEINVLCDDVQKRITNIPLARVNSNCFVFTER